MPNIAIVPPLIAPFCSEHQLDLAPEGGRPSQLPAAGQGALGHRILASGCATLPAGPSEEAHV